MKKLLLILLCVPLIFSCGNNKEDKKSEETWEKFAKIVKDECIKGNEGNTDWEAYCDCGSENFMATIKDIDLKEVSKMPEEELMMMGMEAGLDCMHLLENEEVLNGESSEALDNVMFDFLYNGCMEGEDGSDGWSDYCSCFAENAIAMVPTMEEWSNLSEEDGYQLGIEAGMKCIGYLE